MADETGLSLLRAKRNSSVIRRYRPEDLDALKEITVICFEGVSIDHNIERNFGRFGQADWKARKARDVEHDVAAGGEGIFVWVEAGRVAGYITTTIDHVSKIGRIPNLSVLPDYRGQGVGKALMTAALDYFEEQGMLAAKIETLEQNPIGRRFYPQAGFVEVARQIHYAMPLADRKM
jgi:ribosomal protein S18 acetylase RimI-like enzyme